MTTPLPVLSPAELDEARAYNARRGLPGDEHYALIVSFFQQGSGLSVDGKAGPATMRLLNRHPAPAQVASNPIAEQAILVAIEEIGNGEYRWNNSGPDIARYRDRPELADKRMYGEWCAFFAGYCLEQGATRAGMPLPFQNRFDDGGVMRPIGSAKRLGRRIGEAGSFVNVEDVRRGDIMVWDRGNADPDTGERSLAGHIEPVEFVDRRERLIHTIAGNVGAFPAKVKRRQHDMDRPGRLEFIARLP